MDVMTKNLSVVMVRHDLENLPASELPTPFRWRWYEPGDSAVWTAIQREAERHFPIPDDLHAREFGIDDGPLRDRQLFLLDERGAPIGTATAWFDNGFCGGPWGRIHWVAIVPPAQGRGLAKPLLYRACMRLRELGHYRAYLVTSTARIPAICLYRKFGFVPFIRNEQDNEAWRELTPFLTR